MKIRVRTMAISAGLILIRAPAFAGTDLGAEAVLRCTMIGAEARQSRLNSKGEAWVVMENGQYRVEAAVDAGELAISIQDKKRDVSGEMDYSGWRRGGAVQFSSRGGPKNQSVSGWCRIESPIPAR